MNQTIVLFDMEREAVFCWISLKNKKKNRKSTEAQADESGGNYAGVYLGGDTRNKTNKTKENLLCLMVTAAATPTRQKEKRNLKKYLQTPNRKPAAAEVPCSHTLIKDLQEWRRVCFIFYGQINSKEQQLQRVPANNNWK